MPKKPSLSKQNQSPSLLIGTSVMVAVFVLTCVIGLTLLVIKRDSTTPQQTPTSQLELPNPAAQYCLQNKHAKLIEQLDTQKNVWSYCELSDGRVCEVWELFRSQNCIPPMTR